MTSRPPPPGGRPPRLDSYRPSEGRGTPPSAAGRHPPPHGPPPHGYPQRHSGDVPQPYGGPGRAPPLTAPPRAGGYPPAPLQRKRRQGTGFGAILLYTFLGLAAMVAGAVAFALVALPANFVRDRAVAAVKERTGRDLVVAGPASFTLFPSLGISLSDVSLSGPPGAASARPLATTKAVDISVAFWPLIRREIRVDALVLREPVFHLEVDANGRRSWDFAAADAHRPRVRLAQAADGGTVSDAAPGLPAAEERPLLQLSDVRLHDVRIDNGTVSYHDARTDRTSEFSAINVRLALAALAAPLEAEGNLAWKGKTVSFNGALTSLADVLEHRPAKLRLVLGAGDVLDATFEGSADLQGDRGAEGILSARSASARALAGWFGTDLPPSEGFGPLTAKGLWRGTPERFAFTTAEIALDRTIARGDISLDARGARPFVDANLKLTELDLNTYASGHGAGAVAPSAKPPAADGKARYIEDLLDEPPPPGPRVKGFTRRGGWSEDPYDLALLGILDANAKLSLDKLTVGTVHLDQSDLTVALKNRVMTTTLDKVSLYEGTATGTVILDGAVETRANLAADLTLDGISALPLLKDAAELDRLTGRGRLALTLAGEGASEREIVETLNGRAQLAFTDGAIIGVNIPEMIRNLGKGDLSGFDTAPTDKTDFSEMTSTWSVKSGIAENEDLKLVSPLLRLSGSGRVALPRREVDYTLRPKIVASLAGQGGAQDLSGIEVPVRVVGPWDDPKFTPDVAGALNNPKTVEAIKEIGKQFKGKKTDEIVNDLLSGDSKSRKAKGKKLLEQFLGPQ